MRPIGPGRRYPSLPGPLYFIIAVAVASMLLFGCAGKYQAYYGLANWTDMNFKGVKAKIAQADPERKAWLMENVAPYMDIMRCGVIALDAIDDGNTVEATEMMRQITLVATGMAIDYDPTRLVNAILAEDWDIMLAELMALKGIIIQKLSEEGRL